MKRKHYQEEKARKESLKEQERSLIAYGGRGGSLRVHFIYPNNYKIALSSLGYQVVYRIFAEFSGVVVERAFVEDDYKDGSPGTNFKTFETGRAVADCDILAFCCQFELDYLNVLSILKDSNILMDSAARSTKRQSNPFCSPLVLLGGNAVTINPEPLADYSDVILLGEAEESLPCLMAAIMEGMKTGLSEDDLLGRLTEIEGVYVPRFYNVNYNADHTISGFEKQASVKHFPKRCFVKDLESYPSHSVFVSSETVFDSVFLVETGRGCEMNCRFCASAYFARPVRKRSAAQIRSSVAVGVEYCNTFGFIGTAVSSHPDIVNIAQEVSDEGHRVTLSSLMVKKVSEKLAKALAKSDTRSVALAPETGNDRLRRAIGKRFTNSELIDAVTILVNAGIKRVKLYFMIGLPGERPEDISSIIDLVREVRAILSVEGDKKVGTADLLISLNSFVPKAWTPFQWEPFHDLQEIKPKLALIRKELKALSKVKVSLEQPRESFAQALLSRGDRRVGRLLEELVSSGESIGWLAKNRNKRLLPDVPAPVFYVQRKIDFGEILPWEIIDFGVSRTVLMRETLAAISNP